MEWKAYQLILQREVSSSYIILHIDFKYLYIVALALCRRFKSHSSTVGLFSSASNGSKSSSSSPCEEVTAIIAFGSNMGKRASNIHKALLQLSRIGVVTSTSFLYESSPMYYLEQNSFLNGVCSLRTTHSPEDLLTELKSIESNLGREKTIANGPRPIDLDIIFYGNGTIFESERLQIPHPRVSERAFVLQPLCDVLPAGFMHPISRQTISSLCETALSEMVLTHQQQLQRVVPILRTGRSCSSSSGASSSGGSSSGGSSSSSGSSSGGSSGGGSSIVGGSSSSSSSSSSILEEEGSAVAVEEDECYLRLESGRPIIMGILNMTPDRLYWHLIALHNVL